MFEKLFHLLAISSKNENHSACQVLNFCEEVVEHSFPGMVIAFCELVCFDDEVYAALSVLQALEVLFNLGDSTVRKT